MRQRIICSLLRDASISLQLMKYPHRTLRGFERNKNMIVVRARHHVTTDAGLA
jgi:hypothetical protein